jgi:group II intron reverse transcriptase/maturase
LDALTVGIETRRVNWVLDADLRAFFDTLNHEWLIRCVEHRVADRRVVRLIQQWLSAGVLEDGQRTRREVGTIQGGSISPLLANIYLHDVFDLWSHRGRQTPAQGDVIVVRFADDFVVGFEHREEADRFLADLRERFVRFGLTLHPDKTRLIEFGRTADRNRRGRGDGKPETFHVLGFTHACSRTRTGRFTVLRQTMRRRWQAKRQEVTTELRKRLHVPIPEQGAYLRSVVRGHARYYGVPRNAPSLHAVSPRTDWPVARRVAAAQPDGLRVVVAHGASEYAVAPDSPYLSSVPEPAPGVHDPRQEPDAVVPHVRICAGGDGRPSSLPRLF